MGIHTFSRLISRCLRCGPGRRIAARGLIRGLVDLIPFWRRIPHCFGPSHPSVAARRGNVGRFRQCNMSPGSVRLWTTFAWTDHFDSIARASACQLGMDGDGSKLRVPPGPGQGVTWAARGFRNLWSCGLPAGSRRMLCQIPGQTLWCQASPPRGCPPPAPRSSWMVRSQSFSPLHDT